MVRRRKVKNKRRVKNRRKVRGFVKITMLFLISSVLALGVIKSTTVLSTLVSNDTNQENSMNKENSNLVGDNNKKEDLSENEINNTNSDNNISNENENNNSNNNESLAQGSSGYLSLKEDINATDAKEVQNMLTSWNYLREDGKKIAYLTFDDGPSENVTDEILDVLKEKGVKATFFVLGSEVEKSEVSKNAFKRIVREGHAVGNHGYCHRYDVLYPGGTVNVNAFMDDMKKSEDVMKSVVGDDFKTNIIRFPGGHGSWDTAEVDNVLAEQGYSYIDWNTLNGDAEGHYLSPEQLLNRLRETVSDLAGNDDVIVVLMHDTDAKESTAQYLGSAIDYLRALGYEFKTLK